ncbi:CTTNBP2 N-terminal-like protein [Neosynchiropus ocellatus]
MQEASNLNMESLSKPELLMLFSILEGELEARDLVIEALKAQRKELFIQERYGRYNLSDPFMALQRDREAVGGQNKEAGTSLSPTSNPLVVLKLVVSHCRKMQEKMLAQLATAESRHRTVIADLEEERRRHAEDTAEGDDVTYILEKERERLQQQLDFERSQVRRLEKDQRRMTDQLEEERAQHKQLSCALAKECKWASARALEEGHRLMEVNRKLDKEKESCEALRTELEEERRRALRMEARVEEQLAEFDTEREQLRSRLKKEEALCCQLQQQLEALKRKLQEVTDEDSVPQSVEEEEGKWATKVTPAKVMDNIQSEIPKPADLQPAEPRLNGHNGSAEADGANTSQSEKVCPQNGNESHQTVSSTVTPKSSPNGFQSPYQAGIHQRFHAARHRFQGAADPEHQPVQPAASVSSPAGSVAETSPVKQLARSTVTQVLSRFTTAQSAPKLAPSNNSPFGTDYRSLAAPLSPVVGRAAGALPAGVRSPTIPRAERGTPPPIPPKKPGLAHAPSSPASVPRSASHLTDGPLSGSCGLTSAQDGVKELDVVVSSN